MPLILLQSLQSLQLVILNLFPGEAMESASVTGCAENDTLLQRPHDPNTMTWYRIHNLRPSVARPVLVGLFAPKMKARNTPEKA